MSEQSAKAAAFRALHVKGDPLVLYNIWDVGSAKAVEKAGAKALATGSWSVARAQGYEDGEDLPLDLLMGTAERIARNTALPLSIDMEGGYGATPEQVAATATRLMEAGAIGFNFEDRVVKGEGLYSIDDQCARIAAIGEAGNKLGIPCFINARTDVFLQAPDKATHAGLMDTAIERGEAYATAGASGFFVPGLIDGALIGRVCEAVSLPLNVMMEPGLPAKAELASLGVARISYAGAPLRVALKALRDGASEAFG